MRLEETMAVLTSKPQQTIRELVAEASSEQFHERRAEKRHPFFCPVAITLNNEQLQQFSAFSREISNSGIGLLHNMPVEREEVVLTIYREGGPTVNLRAQIIWCRPCGEGWYLSGARFITAAE